MKVLLAFVLFAVVVSIDAFKWQELASPIDTLSFNQVSKSYEGEKLFDDSLRTGRITNGTPARLGDFPYQVYLIIYRSDGSAGLCGGSIIDKRWILTAAHCCLNVVKVEVFMGAITRVTGVQGSYIKKMTVTRNRSIIMHPTYDTVFKSDDVALVELPEDAPIDNFYIGLIGLPKGLDRTRSLIGLQATVSGFGRVSDNPSSNAVLNYVTLPIVSNTVCSDRFGTNFVNGNHVCLASIEMRSACNGDSGGPLTISGSDGNKVQVGLVSYGAAAGCERNLPQVFAKVSSYIPWIEDITGISFS